MIVGAALLELHVHGSHSLKEKRHVMTSLRNAVESKFSVSFAEVDHQDKWQRAAVGVAAVAPQAGQLDRILVAVRKAVESHPGVEVLEYTVAHMENER